MLIKRKLSDQNEKKPQAPHSHISTYRLHVPTTPHSSHYRLPLSCVTNRIRYMRLENLAAN